MNCFFKNALRVFGFLFVLAITLPAHADKREPWGSAAVLNIKYHPEKVVYDVRSGDKKYLLNLMSRVSLLYQLDNDNPFYGSIVLVLHGKSIPFFAIKHYALNQHLMQLAHSLTVGTAIEFRMCRAAAKKQGYAPKDIDGFVKMVPMADAEIVRLEQAGYAYMQ